MRSLRPAQLGFSYFTVLLVVAILSGGLALTGEVWSTVVQREKEVELLHVGNQYRKAIERYYLNGPKQYPRALADLVKDPRKSGTERYLRQLYPDPITGKTDWGIVKAPDGGVMGVHSLSDKEPIKRSGFRVRDAGFENAKTYVDWKFTYLQQAAPAAKPGATPPPGTPGAPGTAAPSPASPATTFTVPQPAAK
jgi:type II secretory pathway pseudopilin PulG